MSCIMHSYTTASKGCPRPTHYGIGYASFGLPPSPGHHQLALLAPGPRAVDRELARKHHFRAHLCLQWWAPIRTTSSLWTRVLRYVVSLATPTIPFAFFTSNEGGGGNIITRGDHIFRAPNDSARGDKILRGTKYLSRHRPFLQVSESLSVLSDSVS